MKHVFPVFLLNESKICRKVSFNAEFGSMTRVIQDEMFDHIVRNNDTNYSHAFEYRRKNILCIKSMDNEGSACIYHNFDVGMRFMKDVSKLRAMKPASVRLLDNEQFRLGQALKEEASNSLRSHVAQKIAYYMGNFSEKSVVCSTIAFEGTLVEVKLQKKFVRELASAHGGILAGSTVGKAGYALTFAIAYLRDFALNYNVLGESFETFVPWSKLTQVCTKTKYRIYFEHKRRALPGTPFVCCRITQLYDDGACVYFYFCMSISGVAEPSRAFSEIEKSARQEILINGGTLSHHHGLGKRTTLMGEIYTPGYVNALISMKEAIDPTNTFGARNGVFLMMHAQTKSWYIK